jgi:hypothetical protein
MTRETKRVLISDANGSKSTARVCMVCDRLCGRGALSRICRAAGSFDDSKLYYSGLPLVRLLRRKAIGGLAISG